MTPGPGDPAAPDSSAALRRLEGELAAARAALESFVYAVSHDLRAPLRAINGFSQMIEEDFSPILPGEGLRQLAVVRSEAARANAMIDGLGVLCRQMRRPARRSAIDPTIQARTALRELGVTEGVGPPAIAIAPLAPAWADAHLVQEVFRQLLSNAMKFTPNRPGAAIDVGSETRPEGVFYFVRDNGIGFDARRAQRLFEPFQRFHADPAIPGTGIGLALVRQAVVAQGGSISAESEPGCGATFRFTLGTFPDENPGAVPGA